MSEVLESAHSVSSSSDRRKHARQRLRSLTYAELDKENGGIVLDASESGISVQAVVALMDDVVPKMRLNLPHSNEWLEARARVVWTRESRKVAGLQFEDLSERARVQIEEWLSREASDAEGGAVRSSAPPAKERTEKAPTDALGFSAPGEDNPPTAGLAFGAQDETPRAFTEVHISATDQTPQEKLSGDEEPSEGQTEDDTSKFAPNFSAAPPSAAKSAGTAIEAPATAPSAPARKRASAILLAEEPHRTALVYLLLIVLAVVSLTSGWAAGRGEFQPLAAKFRKVFARADSTDPVRSISTEKAVAPVKEIEIVDANNRHWTIPFLSAHVENIPATPAPAEPASASEPDRKAALNLQIWALTPPQRSAASTGANVTENSVPPAVGDGRAGPQIAPIASSPITATSADELPKPAIMTGVLKRGELIHRVEPEYPTLAKDQGISGTVTLRVTVGADGRVREVRVISGPRLLTQAAVNAVRQWRYAPTLLDGTAIETEAEVSLVFRLPNGSF